MTTQQQKPTLEFFGKEGFLDVSQEPNFGTKTLYTPGINNLSNLDVYDELIAEQAQKDLEKRKVNEQ
ncbi:hypothetical protein [Serratia marcescens]|uniref:hypothetical protein n=1 Tax=Serratia marcescens TaxID=615 RepID=UPI001F151FD2|nr:hypothetical protein [Serratia marcescens]